MIFFCFTIFLLFFSSLEFVKSDSCWKGEMDGQDFAKGKSKMTEDKTCQYDLCYRKTAGGKTELRCATAADCGVTGNPGGNEGNAAAGANTTEEGAGGGSAKPTTSTTTTTSSGAKNAAGRKRLRRASAPPECKVKCDSANGATTCLCKGAKCNFGSRTSSSSFATIAAVFLPAMIGRLVAGI